MTTDSSRLAELDELLNKLCTDVLSSSEQQELNSLLRIGVEQRLYYRRYMHLHAAIKWNTSKRGDEATTLKQALADGRDGSPEAASSPLFPTRVTAVSSVQTVCPTGLPTSPPVPCFLGNTFHGTVGYLSSGWPVAYLVATVIFGIGLLIGAFTYVSYPVQVAQQSVPLPLPPLSSLLSPLSPLSSVGSPAWSTAVGRKRD